MDNQVHPLDLALAITLSSVESLLWIINELLGFHAQPSQPSQVVSDDTQPTPQAPQTAPITINRDYILKLTIKQLQSLTGIKSSRYNKAALQHEALLRL